MKKIYLLFVAATLAACSAEPVENEVISLDAAVTGKNKSTVQNAGESFDIPESFCAGEEATFTFNFPQNTNPQGKEQATHIFLQLLVEGDDPQTTEVEESYYYDVINTQYPGAGPVDVNYTFDQAGTYHLQYKIGSGGTTQFSVTVDNCGCDESFTYVDNGDMTYTFTYVPEEDMTDAVVVFTFAQGVDVDGLSGWENNGQTRKMVMDLTACTTYSWTVALDANCSGKSGSSNVWTDFKVNEVSKKDHEDDKFVQSCN